MWLFYKYTVQHKVRKKKKKKSNRKYITQQVKSWCTKKKKNVIFHYFVLQINKKVFKFYVLHS
jgi:hypothetical protein